MGLVKHQTRAALSESGLALSYRPFAAAYAAKQRERLALTETPLMKLGCNVVVKRRVSNNGRVKGFERIGQVAKYLCPVRDSHDGHYVLTEEGKAMKTTRIVPYNILEDEEQDEGIGLDLDSKEPFTITNRSEKSHGKHF